MKGFGDPRMNLKVNSGTRVETEDSCEWLVYKFIYALVAKKETVMNLNKVPVRVT